MMEELHTAMGPPLPSSPSAAVPLARLAHPDMLAKESSKYRRQSDPWAHFDRPSGHFPLQRAITRLRQLVIGGERDTPCFQSRNKMIPAADTIAYCGARLGSAW
jgi:hypothetical protein